MLHWLSQPWPWYIAGPLIGLFVPALVLIGNKPLGATSSLRAMCAATLPKDVDFFKYDWKRSGAWNIALVVGIAAGGFIAAKLLAHDTSTLVPASLQLASLIAVIAIFAGGIVTTWLLLPLIL